MRGFIWLISVLSSNAFNIEGGQSFKLTNAEPHQIEHTAQVAYMESYNTLIFTWIDSIIPPQIYVELFNLTTNEVCLNSKFILTQNTDQIRFSSSLISFPSIAASDITKTFMISLALNSTTIFGALYGISGDCRVYMIRAPYIITSIQMIYPEITPILTTLSDIFVLVYEDTYGIFANLLNAADGNLMLNYPIQITDQPQLRNAYTTTCLASINNFDSFLVAWASQSNVSTNITQRAYITAYNITSKTFFANSPLLVYENSYNSELSQAEISQISLAVSPVTNAYMITLYTQLNQYSDIQITQSYEQIGVIGAMLYMKIEVNSQFSISSLLVVSPPTISALGQLFLVLMQSWESPNINGYLYNSTSAALVNNLTLFNNTQNLNQSTGQYPWQIEIYSFDFEQNLLLSWSGQTENYLYSDNFVTFLQLSQPDCNSSFDCFQSELNYCETNSSTCVQCLKNEECPFYLPLCSQEFRCFSCITNEDCQISSIGDICNQGICVQCLSDNDCTAPNPKCFNNVCQATCYQNSECIGIGNLKVCYQQNCYECLSNYDCSSGELCAGNLSCISNQEISSPNQADLIYILPTIVGMILIISCIYFIRKIRQLRKNTVDFRNALELLQENQRRQIYSQHQLNFSNSRINLIVAPANVREADPNIELRIKDEEEKKNDCVICQDKESSWAPVPCGHMCLCDDCRVQIMSTKLCPLCRTECISIIKIYI